jgi:hypothetical protein
VSQETPTFSQLMQSESLAFHLQSCHEQALNRTETKSRLDRGGIPTMKKHRSKVATFLLLGGLFVFHSSSAFAQSVLFDFDNAPLHSPLPIDLTVGGITAHFSASPTYYNYSIQRADVLGFTPAGFAGNCIYPNQVYACDLLISFNPALTAASIMYAPEEYDTDSSCTMRITAYLGATFVGTNTHSIPVPGTWPTGTLSFSSTQPFDNVVIHYDAPPVTGGDYGPIFMADNLTVTVAAAPTATPTPSPTPATPSPTPAPTATASATASPPPGICNVTEGFDDITTLVPGGWVMQNNSQPLGTTGWFQGSHFAFPAQSGPPDSFIAADSNNGTGVSTLSNWLLTPPVNLQNGAQLSFWTRTIPVGGIPPHNKPNRLQVRMSTNGTSQDMGSTATSVGDFTALLLDINPSYAQFGYPTTWTNFTVTLSGFGGPVTGRLAFRYFVENGGPSGSNSDYIGIDTVQYYCSGTPPPTPTATATATGAPLPTPTPPLVSISGTIYYCSNPVPGPVPNVTLNLTGDLAASTLSDGSGNYQFSSLVAGGSYDVAPTKAALAPGTANINTQDVLAAQRHYLQIALIPPGCGLTAADVNGDSVINTVDVSAIQRFFLGMPTGLANVGKYLFTPASMSYPVILADQTGQNYSALIYGDIVAGYVHRPVGISEFAASNVTSPSEAPAVVAALSLPNVAADALVTNFIVQVTTTTMDAKDKLVGFQGDVTFDERVVTFQSPPVSKAGLTGGNWNVSGNVLPGKGPIRTLRISAYSNDFTPLSGSGTLFNLRMTRASQAAQGTQLFWATPPDHFIFIDADLNTHKPGYAAAGGVTAKGKRK